MSWVKLQQQVAENRFTSFQSITPNQYADNLCLAVTDFNKWAKFVPQYEQQVKRFNEDCVKSFTKNRLRLQEVGISKFEKLARVKANHKIREMIRVSEAEIKKLEKQRIEKLAIDISEKFKVNLFTLKKLL